MSRTPTQPTALADAPEVLPARSLAIVEAQDSATLAEQQAGQTARALATQLGYDGPLSVGALEDEIRFYQRRTVEALLETGKRLLLLREVTSHGNSSQIGTDFDKRVELLGFSRRSAYRFMQAANKTAKSANLALLSTQVKNSSAFLELVTHDDDTLENLKDLDSIDRMSASELRDALRQSEQDAKFATDKRQKAEERADKAERKLAGSRPEAVPLDERIGPFQVEIAERQSLLEKALMAHDQAATALDAWWTAEVTGAPGYDPESPAPMPPAVLAVVQSLHDAVERTASMVGAMQHRLFELFGTEITTSRQYLMQDPALAGQATGDER